MIAQAVKQEARKILKKSLNRFRWCRD